MNVNSCHFARTKPRHSPTFAALMRSTAAQFEPVLHEFYGTPIHDAKLRLPQLTPAPKLASTSNHARADTSMQKPWNHENPDDSLDRSLKPARKTMSTKVPNRSFSGRVQGPKVLFDRREIGRLGVDRFDLCDDLAAGLRGGADPD